MADILLSSPLVWLYLLYVAALVIAHFCAGHSNPSGRKQDRRRGWSGWGIRRKEQAEDGQARGHKLHRWYPPSRLRYQLKKDHARLAITVVLGHRARRIIA